MIPVGYLGSGRRRCEGLVVAGEVAELVLNVVLEQEQFDVLAVEDEFCERGGAAKLLPQRGQLLATFDGIDAFGSVLRMQLFDQSTLAVANLLRSVQFIDK